MLNQSQVNNFKRDGFLVVPGYASPEEMISVTEATKQIIADWQPQTKIFSTDNQNSFLDRYFLESASNNSCFLEPKAIENGVLNVEKNKAINKIGHAMHDTISAFEAFSYRKKLLEIAQKIGLVHPQMVQSQVIFKQALIGEKVNAHTDSTFLRTTPLSCLGAWIAFEDATLENGCLQFIPGSHKWPIQEYYERNNTDDGTCFVTSDAPRKDWPLDQLIPVEVKAGDLVLLDGAVVHASGPNHSSRSRLSYIMHLVDSDCEWPERNWLQRSSNLPFRQMEDVIKTLNL